MAKQKVMQEILQTSNIETVAGRVKKDMTWVIISVVVSLAAGLAVGNFFKF